MSKLLHAITSFHQAAGFWAGVSVVLFAAFFLRIMRLEDGVPESPTTILIGMLACAAGYLPYRIGHKD